MHVKSISLYCLMLARLACPDMGTRFQMAGKFSISQRPADIQLAETEMGHKMSIAKFYVNSDFTWHNMIHDLSNLDQWIGTPIKKLISVPMLPKLNENDSYLDSSDGNKVKYRESSQSLRNLMIDSGGNGFYDVKWKTFAHNMKDKFGNEELFLRLGWEFNLWSPDHSTALWAWGAKASTASDWKNYWIRIANILHDSIPNSKIVWCIGLDGLDRPGGVNPDRNGIADEDLFPGSAYVDMIGIDKFDSWPAMSQSALGHPWSIWEHLVVGNVAATGANAIRGLAFWSGFAKNQGVPICFPEWGLVDSSENPASYGNDYPYYISKMYEYMTNPVNNVLFQVYTGHYHGSNPMPLGIAEYKRLFAPYYNQTGKRTFLLNAWQRAE